MLLYEIIYSWCDCRNTEQLGCLRSFVCPCSSTAWWVGISSYHLPLPGVTQLALSSITSRQTRCCHQLWLISQQPPYHRKENMFQVPGYLFLIFFSFSWILVEKLSSWYAFTLSFFSISNLPILSFYNAQIWGTKFLQLRKWSTDVNSYITQLWGKRDYYFALKPCFEEVGWNLKASNSYGCLWTKPTKRGLILF